MPGEAQVLRDRKRAIERGVLEHDADVAPYGELLPCSRACPATHASPDVGRISVDSMWIVLVLPAPFGPSRPKNWPRGIARSTPSTASVSP